MSAGGDTEGASQEAPADSNASAAAAPDTGEWRIKIAAWALMLCASLLNLLNFNAYPAFRPEIALVLGGLLFVAAVLGLIEKLAPRLAFVFTGALVFLGIDLNSTSTVLPAAFGLAALIGAFFFNRNVVKLAIAAFGCVTLFQAATAVMGPAPDADGPIAAAPKSTSALPPVVHLLMDSALGVEGMESDPAFASLRGETEAFARKYGFRLYRDAYSRHANTANSVPYLLSFGTTKPAKVSQVDERQLPEKLDYFELLTRRGYKVSVAGADFIDLCSGQAIAECRQFPHSKLNAITKFPLSTRDRAVTIVAVMTGMSPALTNINDYSEFLALRLFGRRPTTIRNLKKIGSLKSALALQDMRNTLTRVQPGHAYFVHLLIPHEPYVLDADCAIRPRGLWGTEQTPADRAERDELYSQQMRCMYRLLGPALDALQTSPAGRDAIVIVHGDHGSRIVDSRPIFRNAAAGPRDYAMTYSTFFAIRGPGIAPGEPAGRAALDGLLEDFARSDFRTAPATNEEKPEVILATEDWLPKMRVRLPDYDGK